MKVVFEHVAINKAHADIVKQIAHVNKVPLYKTTLEILLWECLSFLFLYFRFLDQQGWVYKTDHDKL